VASYAEPCHLGGGGGGGGGGGVVGGVTPPKKVKKGAQLAGRGPWHAVIAKFFKNEGFLR
jgi:hypothetical protein